MSIELIIILVVVAAVALVWYVNRDKGLDVNQDGKVDIDDIKLAVENTVTEVKEVVEEKAAEVKKATKKSSKKTPTKKAEKVDLDSMNKTQLLEEAKKRGVAANASLKKDEILDRIKNG